MYLLFLYSVLCDHCCATIIHYALKICVCIVVILPSSMCSCVQDFVFDESKPIFVNYDEILVLLYDGVMDFAKFVLLHPLKRVRVVKNKQKRFPHPQFMLFCLFALSVQ